MLYIATLRSLITAPIIISALVLCGCTLKPVTTHPATNHADALSSQQRMAQNISLHGAQIIQQGMRLTLILPVDMFFRGNTFEIQDEQVETMQSIARYLKSYSDNFKKPPQILVSGHTDLIFDRATRVKRSQQYANVVAAFLWSEGFSTEQLQVKGYGATQPVADPRSMLGSSDNRRVVIEVQ